MTYLTLGFDTTEKGPDGKEVLLATDRTTEDLGMTPDQPFEIPRGKYLLTLRLANEQPTEVTNSAGEMEYHFDKTMWHIETTGVTEAPGHSTIQISVICNSSDSIGIQLRCNVVATTSDCAQLGEMVFTNRGNYELMLVGDVHLCFVDERGPMFDPLNKNLKYYIRVL